MTEAGHVLQPGEVIEAEGLKFIVEKVEKRRLLRVQLELPEQPAELKSAETEGAATAA
jgi:Mg2+/Co2+ transporter CorC